MHASPFRFDVPPFRLTGVVYEALLNDPATLDAMGEAVHQPPHKAAPKAPVLAIKPRNTLAADGARVAVPADAAGLVIGASLGIVIGRTACRVPTDEALQWVAGYLIACDLALPLVSHYRPAVRQRARDGFCPLSAQVVSARAVPRPDELRVDVAIDDQPVHVSTTAGRTRGVAQLLADVTEFMTLQPGDLLLLGPAHGAPLARTGQRVAIAVEGVGRLGFSLVPESWPAGAAA